LCNNARYTILTFREKRGLRVFENRALRRMFGVKKNGVTREGRKRHKRSLSIRSPHPIFFGVTKSRIIRWAGHIARMRQKRDLCRVLVGKAEGKRPRHRWEDNIKMELQEVGCGV
jgi:hypothetical protein